MISCLAPPRITAACSGGIYIRRLLVLVMEIFLHLKTISCIDYSQQLPDIALSSFSIGQIPRLAPLRGGTVPVPRARGIRPPWMAEVQKMQEQFSATPSLRIAAPAMTSRDGGNAGTVGNSSSAMASRGIHSIHGDRRSGHPWPLAAYTPSMEIKKPRPGWGAA